MPMREPTKFWDNILLYIPQKSSVSCVIMTLQTRLAQYSFKLIPNDAA